MEYNINNQTEFSSEYTARNNEEIIKAFGYYILELAENVPDGMIVFMPSYNRLEEWIR